MPLGKSRKKFSATVILASRASGLRLIISKKERATGGEHARNLVQPLLQVADMHQHIDADDNVKAVMLIGQRLPAPDIIGNEYPLAAKASAAGSIPVTTAPRFAIASAMNPPAQPRSSTRAQGQATWV